MAKVPDNDFFYFSINTKWCHNTADHQVADVTLAIAKATCDYW